MNLMDLIKKDKLSPELKRIIAGNRPRSGPARSTRCWTSAGRRSLPNGTMPSRSRTSDTEVREILSLDVYQQLMREQVEKIAEDQGGDAVVSQMEIAKALGMMAAGRPARPEPGPAAEARFARGRPLRPGERGPAEEEGVRSPDRPPSRPARRRGRPRARRCSNTATRSRER